MENVKEWDINSQEYADEIKRIEAEAPKVEARQKLEELDLILPRSVEDLYQNLSQPMHEKTQKVLNEKKELRKFINE